MKKVLVIAVLAVCTFSFASAQENYKPRGGDFSLEVGFAPFGQDIINAGALAGYIHFSDNVALKIGLKLNTGSDKVDNGETGDKLDIKKSSNFNVSVNPGIVYSFKGTPRLTPYIGAGLGLGFGTHTYKHESGSSTQKRAHCVEGDSFTAGLGVATGFNYYFAKNLYVGAEVELGFDYTIYFNEKITNTGSGFGSTPAESNYSHTGANFGIGAYPLLRLGWAF